MFAMRIAIADAVTRQTGEEKEDYHFLCQTDSQQKLGKLISVKH